MDQPNPETIFQTTLDNYFILHLLFVKTVFLQVILNFAGPLENPRQASEFGASWLYFWLLMTNKMPNNLSLGSYKWLLKTPTQNDTVLLSFNS